MVSLPTSMALEQDFDQLFNAVWDAYPGPQPPPKWTHSNSHLDQQPGLVGGSQIPLSTTNSTNSYPIRPLPLTPEIPATTVRRAFSPDLVGESNRPLPTAPILLPFNDHPLNGDADPNSDASNVIDGSEPAPGKSSNYSAPSHHARLPYEDSPPTHPGSDQAHLPLYEPLPPVYTGSQPGLSNGRIGITSNSNNTDTISSNTIIERSSLLSRSLSGRRLSFSSSEPVQDEDVYQQSISELSYIDSPPHSNIQATRRSLTRSAASNSSSVYPITLPPDIPPRQLSDDDLYLNVATASNVSRSPTQILQAIIYESRGGRLPLGLHDDVEEEYFDEDDEDESDNRFVNFTLLSNLAVQLRDKVPRGTHVKGGIPYPHAFTGKDIVTTIHSLIQRELVENHGGDASDRRAALHIARSLQQELFFYEVESDTRMLQDGVEDVYTFMTELEGSANEALPSSVVTVMAKCYSPSCGDGECYAYGCPRKGDSLNVLLPSVMEATSGGIREDWSRNLSTEVLNSLPESERKRQTIIHKFIVKEKQYLQYLDTIDSVYIKPLRAASPPVIAPPHKLDAFIDEVFSNILGIRECNRRLLEILYVRQREQAPVIQRIGDILLEAATEFRLLYPEYVGNYPLADRRMRDEWENNPEFRIFIEKCARRQSARPSTSVRLDLRLSLNLPSEHLQKYPVLLKAILNETSHENPDADYLREAIEAIKNLQCVAQLRTFQSTMARGKWEWHELVPLEFQRGFSNEETRRQKAIFKLVKGEMVFVRDLENIESMYIRPLQNTVPPIIPRDRLERFLNDVFCNFAEIHAHHRRLVDVLNEIQREEHPRIRSITAAIFDAALNFRDAYLQYVPNYPIAAYRIDEESDRNPTFKAFLKSCVRHPDAHRQSMKDFLNCPIPRLLVYERLLRKMYDSTRRDHDDRDAIPQVIEIIRTLGRETEPGVNSSKQKVRLWKYNNNLVFLPGEVVDLDLLNESRSLMHTGQLFYLVENASDGNAWSKLFVLLFDNYLVLTKPSEENGVTKYVITKRPIPLDLLILVNFTEHSRRGSSILRNQRGEPPGSTPSSVSSGPSENGNSRVHPMTIRHNGRLGGQIILYADSLQARAKWKQVLEEAIGLRKVVQESNRVFEIETLSMHTFSIPPGIHGNSTWNENAPFTGKVTCSIPFNTPDGRRLVAIGCAEGVWIGFRHDSGSLRRVLHLRMVTQCTVLDEFGLFLVLSDKQLFAYYIEALAPTPLQISTAPQTPQKMSGNREVSFFSVGKMFDRTYVIYMRKKGSHSHFHVLEPIFEKIYDRPRAPSGFFSSLRPTRSDWFKPHPEFFLSSESFDLVFLKAKIAILSTKGFDIMDLNDKKSIAIPQPDPRLKPLEKRYETCRPIGIFRSNENGFLLCYTEFGIFVDKQGLPSSSACYIEWEGTAESVAFHAPYILLFDSRFIEVRHVETGRLSQIIFGTDIRCVWDGRGLDTTSSLPANPQSDDEMVQEAHVHAVMNLSEQSSQPVARPLRSTIQHVFELIPTIPLYLPGSLAPPTTVSYFPPSSPPSSPSLRPTTFYV